MLSASAAFGACGLLFLLAFCFFFVHLCRLARFGWNARKEAPKDPSPPKKEQPKQPEPVYYIVEKKRKVKKTRTEYGEPKEFRFR